jgi:hypothetical protein
MYTESENLVYPFTDYMGNEWSKNLIDTYNRFNYRVNEVIRLNKNCVNGSLGHKEIEFYLNQRHKTFIQCCEIAKQKSDKIDNRYKVQLEYCGELRAKWVVRFCDNFISAHDTIALARIAAMTHNHKRF